MYLDTSAPSDPSSPATAAIDSGYPSRRVQRVNEALDAAWRRGWASVPDLDPDALIAKAARKAGRNDMALGGTWRERLGLLAHSLESEAQLTPLGRTLAHGQLVAAIANRLRMHALWQRHPEIAEQPLPAPIIIAGQMRSGTTRMQRLLACDPRFGFTRFYESWNPVPLAPRWLPLDDRRLRAATALRVAHWLNPDFAATHPTRVSEADEEIGLLNLALLPAAFEVQWRIPALVRHCETIDTQPVYAEFRRMLQTIAWLRGERRVRSWVLKVPQFMQDLGALLRVFPDARIIRLQRDPAAVIGSSASLAHSQMRLQSNAVDPHWIGREWLRKARLREERAREALARSDAPRVVLDYDRMSLDWRGEMERVYAVLGLRLPSAVRRKMGGRQERAAREIEGRHQYSLATFGLDAATVRRGIRGGDAGPIARAAPSR